MRGLILLPCLALIGLASAASADAPSEEPRQLLPFVALELRPFPWVGLGLRHRVGDVIAFDHTLMAGLDAFPHFEIRTVATPSKLEPFGVWLGYTLRRIDLEGLPPVENFLSAGLALTSPGRKVSGSAGIGLRFQVPPLSHEAASDGGTYLAENVHVDFFIAIRVHPW